MFLLDAGLMVMDELLLECFSNSSESGGCDKSSLSSSIPSLFTFCL